MLDRSIVAGRLQILAVMRQRHDLEHAPARGWKFSAAVASWSIWFIENNCVHTKNSVGAKAGDPLVLTPTQRYIVWCLFGWRNPQGYRRYQKAHIEVSRKYGKSTFAAAVLLLVLLFEFPEDPEAEIYCAATKEKQAEIVFKAAKSMARKSPSIRNHLKLLKKSIVNEANDSFIQPLGSDSDSTDGLNPSVVVKDELHAWMKRHRGLNEKLETGDGARLQPLGITITTAGDDRAEIWKEERAWVVRCLESVVTGEIVDDTVFGFICCIDQEEWECVECCGRGCEICSGTGKIAGDDCFDPVIWPKANPNIGESVDISKVEKHANRARHSPAYLNVFLRYYCNVMTTASSKLIPATLWKRNNGKPFVRPGQLCRGAFDLGRSDDWAAWAIVFPGLQDEAPNPEEYEDGEHIPEALHTYDVITRSYTCEARAAELDNSEVARWVEEGRLEVHPGDQVDFDQIEMDIVEVSNEYAVLSWAFDQMFAPQMAQHLINKHGLEAHKFSQSYAWYNPAVRELLRALRRGDVFHGDDPVLAWQADNLIGVRDARDLIMPDKDVGAQKIDAMVAMLMALGDCLFYAADDDGRISPYENRGIRTT